LLCFRFQNNTAKTEPFVFLGGLDKDAFKDDGSVEVKQDSADRGRYPKPYGPRGPFKRDGTENYCHEVAVFIRFANNSRKIGDGTMWVFEPNNVQDCVNEQGYLDRGGDAILKHVSSHHLH
jgi:hypothetical protein